MWARHCFFKENGMVYSDISIHMKQMLPRICGGYEQKKLISLVNNWRYE